MDNHFFVSALYKPRKAVLYLEQSLRSQLIIFFALLLSYFVQISLFALFLKQDTVNRLLTFNGLVLAILTLIIMGLGLISLIYAASLAFWTVAQCFNGKASLPQTRAAVIWTAIWSIPFGFLFLLVYSTIPHQELFPFRLICYGIILFTLIYGFVVLLKTLSEVNSFGYFRAFFSVIGGIVVLAIMVYITLKFYQAMHWF